MYSTYLICKPLMVGLMSKGGLCHLFTCKSCLQLHIFCEAEWTKKENIDLGSSSYLLLIGSNRVLVLEFGHHKTLEVLVVGKGPVDEATVVPLVAQSEGFWKQEQLCGDVRPYSVCVPSTSPEMSSLTRLQELRKRSHNRHKHHWLSESCGLKQCLSMLFIWTENVLWMCV